ncbi:MAG: methylglyoxal synthase [Oscillospiraceae bacterium]|nr:methylglyoxal synthase [Oscillospiraceae bacterium]
MNIALMSHDNRKELLTQFCIAYCGILSKHTVCSTATTGKSVQDATGMDVKLFMSKVHDGTQQIGARIAYDEIDMVIYLTSPKDDTAEKDLTYIRRLCDEHSVPIATNLATAEMLVQGLARGDLDWREIAYPRAKRNAL